MSQVRRKAVALEGDMVVADSEGRAVNAKREVTVRVCIARRADGPGRGLQEYLVDYSVAVGALIEKDDWLVIGADGRVSVGCQEDNLGRATERVDNR